MDMMTLTAILAVLIVLAAIGVFLWVRHRVTRPVEKLTKAAAAVKAGEYQPGSLADLTKRTDTVGQSARVFEEMASEVTSRDKRLSLLRDVIPIGVALSAERDFNRLLEMILIQAQKLCNADAGTLYLKSDDLLKFMVVRNSTLDLNSGGTTGKEVTLPPLHLYGPDGAPNHRNIATYAALNHVRVNIPDAYNAEGFDFAGTRAFDKMTGYHSQSFLTIPLEADDKNVIGVLQLINAKDPETGAIVQFKPDDVIESLVLLAYSALNAYIRELALRQEIEKLRIEIDQTKQARQVAEITETEYFQRLQERVKELRQRL